MTRILVNDVWTISAVCHCIILCNYDDSPCTSTRCILCANNLHHTYRVVQKDACACLDVLYSMTFDGNSMTQKSRFSTVWTLVHILKGLYLHKFIFIWNFWCNSSQFLSAYKFSDDWFNIKLREVKGGLLFFQNFKQCDEEYILHIHYTAWQWRRPHLCHTWGCLSFQAASVWWRGWY